MDRLGAYLIALMIGLWLVGLPIAIIVRATQFWLHVLSRWP
jgi:hypothetical protein